MSYRFLIFMIVMLLPLYSINVLAQDDHEGHDHADEKIELPVDEHAGHDHGSKENADENNDELKINLSTEAIKLAGITISTVKQGRISRTIELSGEISFNEDNVAHIAPRFAGIAQQAKFRVGDYVNKGDIVAIVESNESLNSYSIKAPISGWVIDRHITTGEFVSEENSIYIIADLSTVWVNLALYPKDVNHIKKNQSVRIKAIGTNNETTGLIEYITPIIDTKTRSLTARVTLPNPDKRWHPGTFVQAEILTESGTEGIVVEKNAVQFLNEKSVIFIVDGPNSFTPLEIKTGDSNNNFIQVLSDLQIGTKYVANGAFELKAKVVTSNLDAHAGHGH